ncbi:MAG: phosphodiesterase, partial [Raoultibacter sp.]
MKILFASDIHGSAVYCRQFIERIADEKPDTVVLLGDLLYHGPRNALPEGYAPMEVADMLNALKERIIAVRGNCEAEVDQMVLDFPCMADYTTLIDEKGHTIFATHGHVWSPDKLPYLAPGSAFLSGHTHVKQLEEISGVLVVNPGSVSIPKDGTHSFGVFEDGLFTLK